MSEAVPAGSLMATKLITNEFVAMLDFKNVLGDVSARTQGIISVYLELCLILVRLVSS